jgi:hypothetical protein
MSRELVIERACRLSAEAAVVAVARALTRAGYQQASASVRGAQLVSSSADHHRVAVSADGQRVVFRFEAAVLGPPLDAVALGRVADVAVGGATGAPAAPVVSSSAEVRCQLCATLAPVGAVTCEVCGARVDQPGR